MGSLISRESGDLRKGGCKGDTVTGGVIDFSENGNGGRGREQFVKLSTFHLSQPRAATQREQIDTDLLLRLASPLRQRLVQLAIMRVPPLLSSFLFSSSLLSFHRFFLLSLPLLAGLLVAQVNKQRLRWRSDSICFVAF